VVTPGDIKLVFVQKIAFVLRKINKKGCHQSFTFSLEYAPNRISAAASPPPFRPSSWPTSKARGEEGKERKGKGR